MKKIRRAWARLTFEVLEDRTVLSPVPTVALQAPSQNFLGESIPISVSFSNTGDAAGYAPYVDVIMPATGVDGNDGITFNNGSATYLGAPVATTVLPFDSSGQATQPGATAAGGGSLIINGPAGDQLIVFQLPFGSFTPGQPPVTIDLTAYISDLARIGVPLDVQSFGVFALGDTAVGDASIVGSTITSPVTPTIVELTKTYLGPEQETATGPNFPHEYELNVTVAPGQTVTNVNLSDVLPINMQFVQVDSATGNGSNSISTTMTPSTSTPGGTLTVKFDQIIGTGNDTDAVVYFTFYIPEFDANSDPVLDPTTGAFEPSQDNATVTAAFTPLNTLDPTNSVSATAQNTITDKSIAIQESVQDVIDVGPPGPSPEDTLQYTLNFQVSDFFAFEQVLSTDIVSDGQSFDTTFTPTITFSEHGQTVSGSFDAANFSAVRDTVTTGETTVTLDISQELAELGLTSSGQLLGGGVPAGGGPVEANPSYGGTQGTITFRTQIDNYYLLQPSPGAAVVEGDNLGDTVTITGQVLNAGNLTPDGSSETDNSAASVSIVRGVLTKSIYAIDGSTTLPSPLVINRGDTVTYALQYTLPESDIVGYQITDYLPLPIFPVSQLGTTFNATISATAPAAGDAQFGPNDTFFNVSGITPTVTVDALANSVTFDFGNYKDPNNETLTTDILFTVTVGDEPFADGLFLTNQAHEYEGSETGGTATANSIVQIQLDEPNLEISKGVVATNDPLATLSGPVGPVSFTAPGSNGFRGSGDITSSGLASDPIDASLSNAQAGDIITFAVVVQNIGSGAFGAYNVTLEDSIPTGFEIPAGGLNFSITDGDGDPLAYTLPDGAVASPSDFFGAGIKLVDPSSNQGALASYTGSSGTNLAVITYDLEADKGGDANPVTPGEQLTNTAEITAYTCDTTGPTFLSAPLQASATVTIAAPTLSKSLVSTSLAQLPGPNLVVGEQATFQLTVTLPDASYAGGLTLSDLLPSGLGYVSSRIVSFGSQISGVPNGLSASVSGSTVAFDFGTGVVETFDGTDDRGDQMVVDVTTLVQDVAGNVNGTQLKNTATLDYGSGTAKASATVNVVVPQLQIIKSASSNTGDDNDVITYTLTVSHTTQSTAPAFGIEVTDPLAAGLQLVVGSVTSSAGTIVQGNSAGNTSIEITDPLLALGSTITITYQAKLTTANTPGSTLTNTATLDYDHGPSTHPDSTSGSATVTVNGNTIGGFVYIDTNNDGVFQNTESPIAGVTITLTGTNYLNQTVNLSATTNGTGAYSFSGLWPGSYTLSENQPAGYFRGIDSPGTQFGGAGTSPPTSPKIQSISIPLESNTSGVSYNFAERQIADLAVSKSVSNPTPNVGDVISYTIGVANNGPYAATDVVIADPLPTGLTFQSDTSPNTAASAYNSATGNWTIGTLADGASYTLTIDTKVVSPNPTTNIASVGHSDQFDPVSSNNTASVTETPQQANVALVKTVSNATPNVGNSIIYTLKVSNAGPNTATNVVVTDPLPAGLAFVSASPPAGTSFTFNALTDTVSWLAGSLAPNNVVHLMTLTVSVNSPNPMLNTATVTADQYDPVLSNNTSSVAIVPQQADLALTKTVSNPAPYYGDIITYTVKLTDHGPNAATNVVVNDLLPVGLTFVSATAGVGTYNAATGNWAVAGIANGASDTLTIQARVLAPGTITNIATITHADQYDPNPASNQASASETMRPTASLSGYVYLDSNMNGVKDPGEMGLPGVTVTLAGTNIEGEPVRVTTTTDSTGLYVFSDLIPGTYTLSATPPSGFRAGLARYGSQGGPGVDTSGSLTGIVLAQAVTGVDNDFAMYAVASKVLLLGNG